MEIRRIESTQRQPKRGHLWLKDGSCVPLRATNPNHVWSYDLVVDKTHDGRSFRMLIIIYEFIRERLAIKVKRNLRSDHVMECLTELFCTKGLPIIFVQIIVQSLQINWCEMVELIGRKDLVIEPGSPRENDYFESFNGKLREVLLNLEILNTQRMLK